MATVNSNKDKSLETPFGWAAHPGVKNPIPSRSNMKREFDNVDNLEIPAHAEWFVFKKRSQRARKQKFRPKPIKDG
jgi:hypothetical protein